MTKIFDSLSNSHCTWGGLVLTRILALSLLLILVIMTQESRADNIFIRKAGSGADDNIQISFAAQSSTVSSTLSDFLSGKPVKDKDGNDTSIQVKNDDTIYIAEGTYTLSGQITIKKNNNLKIYGGFKNDSSFFNHDLTTRDATLTILDGSKMIKVDNEEGQTVGPYIIDCQNAVRIDGFVLANNNDIDSQTHIDRFGAIHISAGSVTVANCIIKNNTASIVSSVNDDTYGTIVDYRDGAGIRIYDTENDVTIENCVFNGNKGNNIIYIAGQDGEESTNATITRTIKQCTFSNNTGTAITAYTSNFHLSDSTFTNNTGGNAGALYLDKLASDSYVKHCTFIGNTGTGSDNTAANIKYVGSGTLSNIYNCILDNGTNINVTGATAENGNLTGITSLTSSTANSATCNVPHTVFAIDNYSQAIGLGKKEYMTTTDQLGRTRDSNYPSIGAVEATPITLTGGSDSNAYIGLPLELSFTMTLPKILESSRTWQVTNSANLRLTKTENGNTIKLSCLPLSGGTGSITLTASATNGSAVLSVSKTITLKISPVTLTADKTEINGQCADNLNQTVNFTITPANNYSWTLEPSTEQARIKMLPSRSQGLRKKWADTLTRSRLLRKIYRTFLQVSP